MKLTQISVLMLGLAWGVASTDVNAQTTFPAATLTPTVTKMPPQSALPPPSLVSMSEPMAAVGIEPARSASLSLDEFLTLVRRDSPGLLADRSLVEMARADLRTASALPNPTVSYSHGAGDRQTSIQQPLPIFGQRGLRMEGARKAIDSARANVDALAADAVRSAAETFVTLLVAQERPRRWSAARDALTEAMAIVEGQVAAGARSRYDLARIRVEAANLSIRLDQAKIAEADTAAQLAAAVGAPGWRPRAIGSLQPAFQTGDYASRWDRAQSQLPAVRAALASKPWLTHWLQ